MSIEEQRSDNQGIERDLKNARAEIVSIYADLEEMRAKNLRAVEELDRAQRALEALRAKPTAPAEDVTAMLEEVTRLDAAATKGPWAREWYEDGESGEGPHGVYPGSRGEMVESNDIITKPTDEEPSGSDIGSTRYGADADFIARARTLLPALAKALEASEQGARMLREDHDNGIALLRKAEAEIETLRTERDGWKVDAVGAKRLADLRQITKEEAEQRADAAEERLEALREKARAWLAASEAEDLPALIAAEHDMRAALGEP